MIFPKALGENLMYEVIRIVLVHLDFFQNHAALAADVGRFKQRIENQIAQHIHRRRQMLVEHLGRKTNTFLRRKRVHIAAERIHLARNLFRRAVLGSLKQHVLDEVRNPVLVRILVARPGLHPNSHRDRADVLHLFRDHGQAVW